MIVHGCVYAILSSVTARRHSLTLVPRTHAAHTTALADATRGPPELTDAREHR